MDNSCQAIREIIEHKQIRTVYQPIVNLLDGRILGYEALSRGPEKTAYESPAALIQLAERCGMTWELDLALRSLAIERALELGPEQLLFINVDPKIIYDKAHASGTTREVLGKTALKPDQVVFELTERSAIEDYEGFNQILQNYVEQGYKIAIDDAGAGFSGINRIIETKPQYIKLDMNIIRGLDADEFKQAIVKSFVQLCQNTNICLIAEGIETKWELKALIRLGVSAGQGFYLQKPSPKLLKLSDVLTEEILRYNQMAVAVGYSPQYHYVGDIAEQANSAQSSQKCFELERFFKETRSDAVCVLKQERILGIVTRNAFNQALSGQYGHAIYTNREVALIVDEGALIVDYYTPIQKVAALAIGRSSRRVYDEIIVKKGSYYFGLVSVKHLLQYAIEYERDYARELNPLTQLPGNTIINRVLKDILTYQGKYVVLYFDLDNFKAYNDIYGFDNGDKVIKMTSKLILEKIKCQDAINSFVGHIGGDDFVAVMAFSSEVALRSIAQEIMDSFDAAVKDYYNEKDRGQGYIDAEDRKGAATRYPLISLSVAGLAGNLSVLECTEALAKAMAGIKKTAKQRAGSCLELTVLATEDLRENSYIFETID